MTRWCFRCSAQLEIDAHALPFATRLDTETCSQAGQRGHGPRALSMSLPVPRTTGAAAQSGSPKINSSWDIQEFEYIYTRVWQVSTHTTGPPTEGDPPPHAKGQIRAPTSAFDIAIHRKINKIYALDTLFHKASKPVFTLNCCETIIRDRFASLFFQCCACRTFTSSNRRMKLCLSACVLAASSMLVTAYTFQGNAAGPCTLSANFPAGNSNCPASDSTRAKCLANFMVQPNGTTSAGAGTVLDPALVPAIISYDNNANCDVGNQAVDIAVFSSSSSGATVAQVSLNEQLETVSGSSLSGVVSGTYRASQSANSCQFAFTLVSGNCFLSDVPAASSGAVASMAALSLAALIAVVAV